VNAKKKQERMRIESRDTIGKLETTEHDADDMAKASASDFRGKPDIARTRTNSVTAKRWWGV
jgi:hypothetical protein